jgi:hypothetical protein
LLVPSSIEVLTHLLAHGLERGKLRVGPASHPDEDRPVGDGNRSAWVSDGKFPSCVGDPGAVKVAKARLRQRVDGRRKRRGKSPYLVEFGAILKKLAGPLGRRNTREVKDIDGYPSSKSKQVSSPLVVLPELVVAGRRFASTFRQDGFQGGSHELGTEARVLGGKTERHSMLHEQFLVDEAIEDVLGELGVDGPTVCGDSLEGAVVVDLADRASPDLGDGIVRQVGTDGCEGYQNETHERSCGCEDATTPKGGDHGDCRTTVYLRSALVDTTVSPSSSARFFASG